MPIPGIDEEPQDNIAEQMKALGLVIERSESILKDADDSITKLIEKRGKLATDVQHLCIRRHQLNQEFQRIREAANRNYWPH